MFVREFEWLTSNTRIAYPFVDRVVTPAAGDGTLFSDMVVDAFIGYPVAQQQDIKLYSLSNPAAATPTVVFRYADNTVAFNGLSAEVRKATIGPWTFLQWTKTTAVARLLLRTADIAKFTWPVTPTDAWLVGHTVQPIQRSVMTIGADVYQFDGFVELVDGYNIGLSLDTTYVPSAIPARTQHRVVIEAVPGDGLGLYPICQETTPPIFTINGISPDDQGNFTLAPEGCYRGEMPVNDVGMPPWPILPNRYKLHNDCSPCCECSDYVYVYDVLFRKVYERAKTVSTSLYAARDQYQDFYDGVVQQKVCREVPRVDLRLTARQGWTCACQVILNNNKGCTANSVDLSIDFDPAPPGILVPDSVKLDADGVEHVSVVIGGSFPNYTFSYTDGVYGARQLILTFELYYEIPYHLPGTAISAQAAALVDGVLSNTDYSTTQLQQVFNKS